MKVIDLLNKIANGEKVPKRIIYDSFTYWYDGVEKDYYKMVAKDLDDEDIEYLMENCFASDILNAEVEVIEDTPKEDKKLEKNINWWLLDEKESKKQLITEANLNFREIRDKINEIIDRLNGDE